MTITVQIPSDIERQIRENVSYGDTNTVRHLLLEVLDPIVEALMNNKTPSKLSDDEFEALLDKLADEFMAYAGPDCPPLSDYAVSREGLYEEHL